MPSIAIDRWGMRGIFESLDSIWGGQCGCGVVGAEKSGLERFAGRVLGPVASHFACRCDAARSVGFRPGGGVCGRDPVAASGGEPVHQCLACIERRGWACLSSTALSLRTMAPSRSTAPISLAPRFTSTCPWRLKRRLLKKENTLEQLGPLVHQVLSVRESAAQGGAAG